MEQDLTYFKREFLDRYELMGSVDPEAWFDWWFAEQADGTARMLPDAFDGFERDDASRAEGLTVDIGGNAEINGELRR